MATEELGPHSSVTICQNLQSKRRKKQFIKSWENKKFNGYTKILTVRISPQMSDQLKLLSRLSKREASVYVRHWIESGLRLEATKEKDPLEVKNR